MVLIIQTIVFKQALPLFVLSFIFIYHSFVVHSFIRSIILVLFVFVFANKIDPFINALANVALARTCPVLVQGREARKLSNDKSHSIII